MNKSATCLDDQMRSHKLHSNHDNTQHNLNKQTNNIHNINCNSRMALHKICYACMLQVYESAHQHKQLIVIRGLLIVVIHAWQGATWF